MNEQSLSKSDNFYKQKHDIQYVLYAFLKVKAIKKHKNDVIWKKF